MVKMGCEPYNRCIELFNNNVAAITDPYSNTEILNTEFKHTPYNELFYSKIHYW